MVPGYGHVCLIIMATICLRTFLLIWFFPVFVSVESFPVGRCFPNLWSGNCFYVWRALPWPIFLPLIDWSCRQWLPFWSLVCPLISFNPMTPCVPTQVYSYQHVIVMTVSLLLVDVFEKSGILGKTQPTRVVGIGWLVHPFFFFQTLLVLFWLSNGTYSLDIPRISPSHIYWSNSYVKKLSK